MSNKKLGGSQKMGNLRRCKKCPNNTIYYSELTMDQELETWEPQEREVLVVLKAGKMVESLLKSS